jgi:hypothetical protein
MHKLVVPFAFLASTSVMACAFEMHAGTKPNTPAPPPATAAKAPAPAPTPTPGKKAPTIARIGSLRHVGTAAAPGTPATPATPGTATPGATPPPGTPPILTGANAFGSGTADPTGWTGALFVMPAGTTKLPDLTGTPAGILFSQQLNVASQAMTGGFAGIDPNRNTDFAIRYEAPLVVDNEADYTFRVVADDGAKLSIDGLLIVDDDGARATSAEKSGPVHLVKGTHQITVDYLQTTGNVALQVFCSRPGMTEAICPTKL